MTDLTENQMRILAAYDTSGDSDYLLARYIKPATLEPQEMKNYRAEMYAESDTFLPFDDGTTKQLRAEWE